MGTHNSKISGGNHCIIRYVGVIYWPLQAVYIEFMRNMCPCVNSVSSKARVFEF
jgi:hypothetical protein